MTGRRTRRGRNWENPVRMRRVIAYLLSRHERHAGQLFRDGRLEIAVLVFAVMLEVGSCREVLAVNLRLGVFEICVRVTWRGILRGVGDPLSLTNGPPLDF